MIGNALQQPLEGIMKRNAKNDKSFKQEVDGLIYDAAEEDSERQSKGRRVIENVIIMPMVSPKGHVIGVI